jgi:hypothetical protein
VGIHEGRVAWHVHGVPGRSKRHPPSGATVALLSRGGRAGQPGARPHAHRAAHHATCPLTAAQPDTSSSPCPSPYPLQDEGQNCPLFQGGALTCSSVVVSVVLEAEIPGAARKESRISSETLNIAASTLHARAVRALRAAARCNERRRGRFAPAEEGLSLLLVERGEELLGLPDGCEHCSAHAISPS